MTEPSMTERAQRQRRRWWAELAYLILWVSATGSAVSADPKIWGIPLWYLWATVAILLLVPLNAWFVHHAWPEDAVPHRTEQRRSDRIREGEDRV